MTSNEIRNLFLDFFKEKNHRIVPGYALVPDDPTLLFTSAGMVQFKSLWVEKKPLPFSRAATVQKCLRAGGKDSDLENVGKSVKHHSFLEMLGNFSFGDYFKKEAISWAWEFLIKVLKLPRENLWVSVYEKDRESFQIWKKIVEVKKIVFLGKEDNFWGPAGDSGPCGPCSEIYFDLGEKLGCGKKNCQPGCSCRRFLEFWNLVFPQFNQEKGKLFPLSRKGVDTGMGLERIASICQGKNSDYETDLFTPIIEEIEKLVGVGFIRPATIRNKINNSSIQIVADHIRAVVFAISDGIYPENVGRGYVIRRIIRRASRAGRSLEINRPFLYRLVPVVSEIMREPYPYLSEKSKEISQIIKKEEERFAELLGSGKDRFMQVVASLKGSKVLTGEVLFKLYDTYGLPLDLIEELGKERGLTVDRDGFTKLIERQRERGRRVSKFASSETLRKDVLKKDLKRTIFVGYEKERVKTKILDLFRTEHKVRLPRPERETVQDSQRLHQIDAIVLQETPFYPEKGGQVGDKGLIKDGKMEFEVTDTQKDRDDVILHLGRFKERPSSVIKGKEVIAAVDRNFRKAVSANHTATHLLHWALRKVLSKEVRQAGSFVGEKYLRFDFTYSPEVTWEKLKKVEALINEKVRKNSSLSFTQMNLEEAKSIGALALFGEKYEKRVRVVSIGDYSKEVCGGTHLTQTGEIGLFLIKSLSSIGKGIRRIEAITREIAYEQTKAEKAIIEMVALRLKTPLGSIPSRIEQLLKEEREERKKREVLMNRLLNSEAKELLGKIKLIKGIKLILEVVDGFERDSLRILAESLRERLRSSGIILLAARIKDKPFVVATITDDLIKKGFSADFIIKEVTGLLGGGGGGRVNFAQGSGKDSSRLKEALEKMEKIIESHEEKRAR